MTGGEPEPLNQMLAKFKFKMESARTLKDLVRRKDWMISIKPQGCLPFSTD